jgi:hypothetical protein
MTAAKNVAQLLWLLSSSMLFYTEKSKKSKKVCKPAIMIYYMDQLWITQKSLMLFFIDDTHRKNLEAEY